MQIIDWKQWKTTVALLTITLTVAGLSANPSSAATTDPNPMCAKFVGDTTILGSDGKGVYCPGGDVLCGSGGKGFVLTTTYKSPSQRKAWVDLKSAVQYYPSAPVKSLPRGEVEVEINWMGPNDPDGNFLSDVVPAPLSMSPGTSYIAGLRIRIIDGKNYYDLRFGQPRDDAPSSGCPVLVTAGADLDSEPDGIADIWTIEPLPQEESSPLEARAILFKGKPNYDVAPGNVIGHFKVPFTLVFVREQFGAILNEID